MEKAKTLAPKRNVLRNTIIIILSAVVFLLFIVPPAALSIFLHRHVDYRGIKPNYPLRGIFSAEDYGLSETVHSFTTTDGESLWCAEIKADEPKGVVIYLSGIVQPSVTYFYAHSAWLLENGYSSFLLDLRSHGESSGKLIGLGYTEVEDVRAVVDYISYCGEYDGVPVIVHGVSMGGAVALNSFGQIPEIDGCIAMSPYSSFENELELLMEQYGLPKFLRDIELPVLSLTLDLIYGRETTDTLAPEKQIQNAGGRPVFLIACGGDTAVPAENTQVLSAACPEAEVWIRDSWEHFIISGCDFANMESDKEYCSRILGWLDALSN